MSVLPHRANFYWWWCNKSPYICIFINEGACGCRWSVCPEAETYRSLTLDQIINGCRRGDMEARRELYERYGATMYGVVRRYVRDAATAEDLLHDGFVTLYTRIDDYRGEGSFEGWCRRIFVNTVLSYFRKKNPLNEADDVEMVGAARSVEPTAISQMSADEIKKCVDDLPHGYKTIFNLHAVEGYAYPEIADMMNISEATARSQYLRARGKLAEIINRRYRDDEFG